MPQRNLYAILAVSVITALCWQSTRGDSRDEEATGDAEAMELYGVFVDAVEQVEANYVKDVSRKELLNAALQGMLQSLDPHSSYFTEEEWQRFRRNFEGSFSGIGISVEIDPESKRLKVLAPLIGTPAYEAGVLAGDLILEVDGQSTEGISRDRAIELLQGRPGTTVSLKVLHPGRENAETIEITRALINTESVLGVNRNPDNSWNFVIDPEAGIGYIRVTSFQSSTSEEILEALQTLRAQQIEGLILDLRTNPGGLLSAAVEVADLFVEDGPIVSTQGRNTRERRFVARPQGTFLDFQTVVLVNQHTASAAEIVSACLQDAGRAKIVGQRSFGKGSVQNIIPLEGGDILKLTVETYLRPSGRNIHKFPGMTEEEEWGVSPDEGLVVELSDEEYVNWERDRRIRDRNAQVALPDAPDENDPFLFEDRQLDKALEVLRKQLGVEAADAQAADERVEEDDGHENESPEQAETESVSPA